MLPAFHDEQQDLKLIFKILLDISSAQVVFCPEILSKVYLIDDQSMNHESINSKQRRWEMRFPPPGNSSR
jgi:hypothetical protein